MSSGSSCKLVSNVASQEVVPGTSGTIIHPQSTENSTHSAFQGCWWLSNTFPSVLTKGGSSDLLGKVVGVFGEHVIHDKFALTFSFP